MTIKEKSKNKSIWDFEKEKAVALGKSWIAGTLKDYPEHGRSGIRKGLPVGFSRKKQEAALLSILHPLLQIQELARLSDVSPNVLMVWRTQPGFKKVVEEKACRPFGEQFRNSIQNETEQRDGDSELRPNFKVYEVMENGQRPYSKIDLIRLFPFFNPLVSIPTLNLIKEKAKSKDFSKYIFLVFELHKSLSLYQNRTMQNWAKSPENVSFIKFLIDSLLVLLLILIKPENRREIDDELVREAASAYRSLLFGAVDLLAGVEPSEDESIGQEQGRV